MHYSFHISKTSNGSALAILDPCQLSQPIKRVMHYSFARLTPESSPLRTNVTASSNYSGNALLPGPTITYTHRLRPLAKATHRKYASPAAHSRVARKHSPSPRTSTCRITPTCRCFLHCTVPATNASRVPCIPDESLATV